MKEKIQYCSHFILISPFLGFLMAFLILFSCYDSFNIVDCASIPTPTTEQIESDIPTVPTKDDEMTLGEFCIFLSIVLTYSSACFIVAKFSADFVCSLFF